MNRWLRRRSVRVLLVLLGLFVAASIAVRIFFPAERMKELALEQIEARTGMVATAGPASVQFPWPLGLSVEDLSLEDADGDAAYERLKLTAASILIQADLMSILRRQPQINQIRLDKPQLVLALREAPPESEAGEGEGAPPPEGEERPESPAEITAVLSVLQIDDGRVELTLVDERVVVVEGIQQRAGVRVEKGRAKGEASGGIASLRVSGEEPLELPALAFAFSFDASMDPASPEGTVELRSAEMGGVELSGRVSFALVELGTQLAASLDAEAGLPDLFEFARTQAPLPKPYDEQLKVDGGALRAHLEFDGLLPKEPDPEAVLEFLRLDATLSDARVRLSELEFQVAETTLGREGAGWGLKLRDIRGPGLGLKADAQLPLTGEGQMQASFEGSADLARLRQRAPSLLELLPAEQREGLPPQNEWPGIAGMLTFDGGVTASMPPPEDPAEIALEVRLKPRKLALLPVAWNDSLRADGGSVVLHTADAEFSGIALGGPGLAGTLDGSAWGWPEAIELEADLSFSELDADLLRIASTPKTETAWRLPSLVREARAAKEPEPFVPPANLAAELRVRASSLKSNGYTLRDIDARASMRDQKLSVPALTAKLGDGTVQSNVEVDWTQDPPVFDAKSVASDVPASELLRPVAGPLADALTTRFSGELDLLGPVLDEPDALKQAISGITELRSDGGVLDTEPILGASLSSFLGKHYDDFQTLDFRSMTAGLRIDSGQVHFEKMLVDGNTRVNATGAVGLDGRCDYKLDVLLPAGATPALGDLAPVADLLRDDEGRIGFAVAVTGPAKKPKVQIDWESLAKRARDRGAEQLEDDLKKKAKSALEGLFGGKKGGG